MFDSNKLHVRIEEKVEMRPNGDRDTSRHPCSSFEVYLVRGSKKSLVYANTQYNSHWVSIEGTREEFLGKAEKAAKEIGSVIGDCDIIGVMLTNKEREIFELEEQIKENRAKIEKLKKSKPGMIVEK